MVISELIRRGVMKCPKGLVETGQSAVAGGGGHSFNGHV